MLGLLFNLANISGGILLGLTLLDKWDGDKDYFNKIAKVLAPFQTAIGGVLIVLSLFFIIGGNSILLNIVSFLGGFLLLTHVLSKAPSLEDTLLKLSDKLMPFKAGIGVTLIVIGVLGLF
jgi:hypothetical protein